MTHLQRPLNLKKSLGQHFLKDELVCQQIADALKQNKFTQLLEIGPGGGALTKYLIAIEGVNFMAVEIDREKVAYLKKIIPPCRTGLLSWIFFRWKNRLKGPLL